MNTCGEGTYASANIFGSSNYSEQTLGCLIECVLSDAVDIACMTNLAVLKIPIKEYNENPLRPRFNTRYICTY